MWRLNPVPEEQFVRELRGIASRLHPAGNVEPHFLRLLAQSPASLTAYLRAEEALGTGRLTPHQREEISLAVAEINGSHYCVATHELAGKHVGLSDEDVSFARKAWSKDSKTQAMLHFVQAIVLQRGEISDDDFSAMRSAGFAGPEIIEILANVGLNIFTNYFNLLAQTDLDHPSTQTGPPGRAPNQPSEKDRGPLHRRAQSQ